MTRQAAFLLSYIDEEWDTVERLRGEIDGVLRDAPDELTPDDTVVLGYALHNLYSALEDIFEHVARTFENTIEDPARYHAELVKRMKIDVHKVRPALLSDTSYEMLNELRAFWHVFRHAYDYELDGGRVKRLAESTLEAWSELEEDEERFRQFLLELVDDES